MGNRGLWPLFLLLRVSVSPAGLPAENKCGVGRHRIRNGAFIDTFGVRNRTNCQRNEVRRVGAAAVTTNGAFIFGW